MKSLIMQFHSPDVIEHTTMELALYGKLDPVRMMVNSAIRRFVGEHRELMNNVVLDYGAGKPGSCRVPQPFRHLITAASYHPWEPGDDPPAVGVYSAILCTQVLQNVFDLPSLFRQFAGYLRPGGHLVVTYPVAWQEIENELWRITKHGAWALCHQANLAVLVNEEIATLQIDGTMPLSLVNGLVARKAQ